MLNRRQELRERRFVNAHVSHDALQCAGDTAPLLFLPPVPYTCSPPQAQTEPSPLEVALAANDANVFPGAQSICRDNHRAKFIILDVANQLLYLLLFPRLLCQSCQHAIAISGFLQSLTVSATRSTITLPRKKTSKLLRSRQVSIFTTWTIVSAKASSFSNSKSY